MEIQERLIKFVTRANWVLFFIAGLTGLFFMPPDFAMGIICGGLIVTINFHLLYRTLKKAFRPPHLASAPGDFRQILHALYCQRHCYFYSYLGAFCQSHWGFLSGFRWW